METSTLPNSDVAIAMAKRVRRDSTGLHRSAPLASRRPERGRRSQRSSAAERARVVPVELAVLRIAVLDSDSGFLVVLTNRLERLEWKHRVLASTVSRKRIASMDVDALIVDPAILGPRCWDWLERLCQARPKFRIVVCTGSSTVTQRVRALRMGVDDWLSKPCHPEELIARIEAVVGHRHRPESRDPEPITVGELEIRRDQYQAFVLGRSLRLTRREFEMIELLAGAESDTVERELIYERLWGYPMARNDRSVDVFVHKLRRKLRRASPHWRYIHTHFGVGYRLAAEPSDGSRVAPHELEPVGGPQTVGEPPSIPLAA
jgi:DNA-binding response OmpR family regulator